MILLIDNYDSFVHNLSRYFGELGCETIVRRNDAVSLEDIRRLAPEAIVLSPGPGTPTQAGICISAVQEFAREIPLLGVCLGHQAIAEAFGGEIIRARTPVHGRTSAVFHDGTSLFAGLPNPLTATRYHSLIVDEQSLPDELRVTARTSDGTVMALEHATDAVFGLQFHPESILTETGHSLLGAFLVAAGRRGDEFVSRELTEHSRSTPAEHQSDTAGQVIHW